MDNFYDAFVEYFIRYIHEIDSIYKFVYARANTYQDRIVYL